MKILGGINNNKTIKNILKKYGIRPFLRKIRKKIFPVKSPNYIQIQSLFKDKIGLEIGGPSSVFETYLPVYSSVKHLDGCNFSTSTVWEGNLKEGLFFNYGTGTGTGYQYILEATDLSAIENDHYDFVISAHCLEHVANPLKAVKEWIRVIKNDGLLLLILPNKNYCFDHNRNIVAFSHLLQDFENNVDESDLSHLEEIIAKHDLSMDVVKDKNQFKNRSLKNFENRCLHHHVFDINVLEELFSFFGLMILYRESYRDGHIIIGKKLI